MDMRYGYVEVVGVAREQQHMQAYAPLVKRIVRQLNSQVGGAMEREDMEQIGLMGLLDCLRRYGEPDDKFAGFASLRIRGAILDELRRQDWRPRGVRQACHRHRDAMRALMRKVGREPTEAEAVAALGISPEEYREYQVAENAEELASFDEMIQELGSLPSEAPTPETLMLRRRSIEEALLALNEREQRVIQLYYEFDLSLKEIAAVLDLTEARVCQINKVALRKMHDVLQG
jgi:RNA polymerase sigma factor for flagellar operon FliA